MEDGRAGEEVGRAWVGSEIGGWWDEGQRRLGLEDGGDGVGGAGDGAGVLLRWWVWGAECCLVGG